MNIIPFGDSEAHGAIGNTIVFQRRRGGVFARKYTWKKYTRTTAQDKQRIKFRNCIDNYTALSPAEKEYYDMLAYGKKYTGQNLFVSRCLLTPEPSTTPLNFLQAYSCNIDNLRGSQNWSWLYEFHGLDPLELCFEIPDNKNIMYSVHNPLTAPKNIRIYVHRNAENCNVQAGDTVTLDCDTATGLKIYFPELIGPGPFFLYPADDGSTYWDAALTDLAYSAVG